MNKSLIKKLTDKWDKPDGLPAKGHELVTGGKGLSPCAQSEAIMLSKGLGVTDFEAFWKGGLRGIWGPALNLDKVTAQTLGISVTHSILLRRFNDLSSRSPSVVLTDPEKVLGKNWKKVLDFWSFVDSLEQDDWRNLLEVASGTDDLADFREKRITLRESTDKLDVIYPDLHYLPGVSKEPLETTSLTKKTVDEALEMYPDLKKSFSVLQQTPRYLQNKGTSDSEDGVLVVGDYSRAYFGWIATFDYFLTNFQTASTPLRTASDISKLQLLFSCATNEIQVLEEGQTFEDLYFCKLIGYDPFRNRFLEKFQERAEDILRSISLSLFESGRGSSVTWPSINFHRPLR
jgi:hypothetical protein